MCGNLRIFRIGVVTLLTMVLVAASGCNTLGRQPKFREAQIEPSVLKPGDSAIITVLLIDKIRTVDKVVGVLPDYPGMKLALRDDGNPPDEQAADGIWTLQVDVPFMAPPGEFVLDITAFDRNGDVVIVKQADKSQGPLSTTCTLEIQYPPEQ